MFSSLFIVHSVLQIQIAILICFFLLWESLSNWWCDCHWWCCLWKSNCWCSLIVCMCSWCTVRREHCWCLFGVLQDWSKIAFLYCLCMFYHNACQVSCRPAPFVCLCYTCLWGTWTNSLLGVVWGFIADTTWCYSLLCSQEQYTRNTHRQSANTTNRSGLINHTTRDNHIINWQRGWDVDRISYMRRRHVEEVIWIYKTGLGTMTHPNDVTSNKREDTLICIGMLLTFLYIPGDVTLGCLEVVPVVYAIPWKNTSELARGQWIRTRTTSIYSNCIIALISKLWVIYAYLDMYMTTINGEGERELN